MLRTALENKRVDPRTISNVIAKARREIEEVVQAQGNQALEQAVEMGVEKKAPDFINELQFDMLTFEVDTESGITDFSEPPRPMLPFLLQNAKPIKDGSGVYKVIPVGKPGTRAKVSTSIIDAQKQIVAERAEAAHARAKAMAPAGSKTQGFRTATSKQNPETQWVLPATEKDFTDELKTLNESLTANLEASIRDIIESYLEMY